MGFYEYSEAEIAVAVVSGVSAALILEVVILNYYYKKEQKKDESLVFEH